MTTRLLVSTRHAAMIKRRLEKTPWSWTRVGYKLGVKFGPQGIWILSMSIMSGGVNSKHWITARTVHFYTLPQNHLIN